MSLCLFHALLDGAIKCRNACRFSANCSVPAWGRFEGTVCWHWWLAVEVQLAGQWCHLIRDLSPHRPWDLENCHGQAALRHLQIMSTAPERWRLLAWAQKSVRAVTGLLDTGWMPEQPSWPGVWWACEAGHVDSCFDINNIVRSITIWLLILIYIVFHQWVGQDKNWVTVTNPINTEEASDNTDSDVTISPKHLFRLFSKNHLAGRSSFYILTWRHSKIWNRLTDGFYRYGTMGLALLIMESDTNLPRWDACGLFERVWRTVAWQHKKATAQLSPDFALMQRHPGECESLYCKQATNAQAKANMTASRVKSRRR